MVWAISMSSTFGEFFPKGDFRGYGEALAAHYKAEVIPGRFGPLGEPLFRFTTEFALDGDGKKIAAFSTYQRHVSSKFHAEPGVRSAHDPTWGPIEPHEWPEEFVFEKLYSRPAALIKLTNRMYAVDERLRDILEQLEPGVHRFNPIRMMLPKRVEHPVKHQMIVVGRWLSSFRRDQSDPDCLDTRDARFPPIIKSYVKNAHAGVAMSAAEIGDAHLWCERWLHGADFFISDRLKDVATNAGLRLPTSHKMKSVRE
jgi:hypothetical protein